MKIQMLIGGFILVILGIFSSLGFKTWSKFGGWREPSDELSAFYLVTGFLFICLGIFCKSKRQFNNKNFNFISPKTKKQPKKPKGEKVKFDKPKNKFSLKNIKFKNNKSLNLLLATLLFFSQTTLQASLSPNFQISRSIAVSNIGNINIISDKNLNQSQSNSNLKERIHFVDYKSDNTNLKETNVKSNIVSNNINLNANEITLKASNLIAQQNIQIDTTRLNLISDKDNHTSISNSNNKDTLIAEVKSNGKIQEIEIPAIIQTGDKFILNGKDISDKLDTKIYQTISNSLNDETIKNSIIKQISSNSKTPLNQEEINQIQVALNSDEWDKSTKRL